MGKTGSVKPVKAKVSNPKVERIGKKKKAAFKKAPAKAKATKKVAKKAAAPKGKGK